MGDLFGFITMLIMIIASICFLRPRGKQYKSMSDMRKGLKVGDRVSTFDGICGNITEVLNNENLLIKVGEEAIFEFTRGGVCRMIDDSNGEIKELYFDSGKRIADKKRS